MHALRTKFAGEIIAEFLPPSRTTKKHRVIILLGGAPSVPEKSEQLEFFSKKGFWVFFPRYRGSWESGGLFLQKSLDIDVIDIISQLPKGFNDIWNNKTYRLQPDQIILIGSSFGGPAALLASRDARISKVLVVSPVIDWTKPGKDEPLDKLESFFTEAFGNGYRTAINGWKKISSGTFYNPINHISEIDGKKILMLHAKDDTICPYENTRQFAKATQSKLITLPRGGHLGSSILLKPRFYNTFKKFINT